MAIHLPKINLISLVAALLLFFLPWTDVRCSGRHMATQSGFQSIYGGVSVADDLQGLEENADDKPDIGMSIISTIVFLLLLAGAAAAAAIFFQQWASPVKPGALALAALALILLQSIIGFPINRSIRDAQKESATRGSAADQEMARAMGALVGVEATRTGWFYLALVALAVPAGLYANQRWGKRSASADSFAGDVRNDALPGA